MIRVAVLTAVLLWAVFSPLTLAACAVYVFMFAVAAIALER